MTLGAAALLLAGLAVAGSGQAQPPFGRHHGGPGGPGGPRGPGGPHVGLIEEHAEQLGVDEETLEKIRAIVDESRAAGEDLRAELRDAHGALRELLSQDSPDFDAAMAQVETIGELEIQERKNRLGAMLRIRSLMTPEQRAELSRIREEARSRRFAPLMDSRGAVPRGGAGPTDGALPARERRSALRGLPGRDQRARAEGWRRAAISEHGPRGGGRFGPRAP
jgi:Spy/CpxP family protein refolding chaperone